MLRITIHIERLLQIHDCVIVPELGGFVLQSFPAILMKDEQVFRPMHKEIVFNSTLRHNDGLLAEAYMKIYEVDYSKAKLMVEEDVKEITSILYADKEIKLGKVGTLKVGEEGQLFFSSADITVFSPDTYGLPPFHFKPLQSLPREEQVVIVEPQSKKDTIYIPVSKTLLKGISAAAAALALFLIVSTPVKDIDKSAYTASFIPTSLKVEPVVADCDEFQPEEIIVEKPEESLPLVVEEPIQPIPVANKKMYHIVIGSLVTEKQADDFIADKVDKSICPNVNKITRDGKVRVYADRFDNREEAESYLEKLRVHEAYKDAWLFISR